MDYFELRTARDMLEKAHRERKRLRKQFNVDNVFNFFVTVYHIYDYVYNTKPCLREKVKKWIDENQDIQDCRDLCNKGKHLVLDRPNRLGRSTGIFKHHIAEVPLGILRLGGGRPTWALCINDGVHDRAVDVEKLADRALAAWESFFSENGL